MGCRSPEPSAPVDDLWVRLVGIPAFGLVIPVAAGLFQGLGPHDPAAWLGAAGFVTLSAAIWHGNRWLLFEQRRHFGWFDHPIRKVMMLLAAIVLYTAPLTMVSLLAWFGWIGRTPDWVAIRFVVLVNVICVSIVAHVYETVFLIKERQADLLRVAQLDRARVEAELSAVLSQLDPHFMFNSLNTLGHLVSTDPPRARVFTDTLAEVYRYLLRQRGRALVALDEELEFLSDYVDLLRIRFGDALQCTVQGDQGRLAAASIPPTSLQLLVENAVKHNEVGEGHPLHIEVVLYDRSVTVACQMRPRRQVRTSAGVGLRNLDERARLALGRPIIIDTASGRFSVTVPLGSKDR